MPRATDGCGKTDDFRPVDRKKWERGWLRSNKYGYKCMLCNRDGSEKHVNDKCPICKGIGYLDKRWYEKCIDCKGSGISGGIPDFEGTTEVCTMSFCQTCKGAGYKKLLYEGE